MKRKDFIKNTLVAGASALIGKHVLKRDKGKPSTYDAMMENSKLSIEQVGFNYIPNYDIMTNKTVLHKANTRGHANHGWLDSHHSFSFANYHNPERTNFGVLRVLNDDVVASGRGFAKHPHDNMEIISIPLEGDLEHKDSTGTVAVIKAGDIQVMSAGSGIQHSEINRNKDQDVRFLQIWLFPNKKNVDPRYDQIKLDQKKMQNELAQVLSPNADDEGVWIHQDAWFHMGNFDLAKEFVYELKRPTNGIYAFVLEGSFEIEGQDLDKRDGFGIWNADKIVLRSSANSSILIMEVPMSV